MNDANLSAYAELDVDAIPHTERPRALIDHHQSFADAFVAEYEAGLYGLPKPQ